MNSKASGVAVATVGYMCLAIGGWMTSMTNAAWFSRVYSTSILFPLAIVLLVTGILAYVNDRGIDAVAFLGGSALFGTIATYTAIAVLTRMSEPLSFIGWIACAWAVYFACAWAGSLHSGMLRSDFLLGVWVTLGVLAIAGWTGVHGWTIVGGYLGLLTALLAIGVAGSEIIHYEALAKSSESQAPGTTTARPMAAD